MIVGLFSRICNVSCKGKTSSAGHVWIRHLSSAAGAQQQRRYATAHMFLTQSSRKFATDTTSTISQKAPKRPGNFIVRRIKHFWYKPDEKGIAFLGFVCFGIMVICQMDYVVYAVNMIKKMNWLRYYRPDGELHIVAEKRRQDAEELEDQRQKKLEESKKAMSMSASVANELLFDEPKPTEDSKDVIYEDEQE